MKYNIWYRTKAVGIWVNGDDAPNIEEAEKKALELQAEGKQVQIIQQGSVPKQD